ncbi:hypothetical protein [Falsiroseomonas sp. CW058]|uniref:hypothetical protein n=1 Tax=Falsiroseomonas sp. CW058 TaxID=3388664 RepID=UPI003D31C274
MSLLGARSAVVSLGASCQTARQIRLHAPLLAERMGEALAPRSFPLDWMFAPPDAVARLLRSETRIPAEPGELVAAQRPFWPRHGVWLWHDPMEGDGAAGDFAAMQARMARRWDRFVALRSLERRVFVLSNTQNNLARLPDIAPQRLDFRLDARRMRAVAGAVQALFGAEGTEVLFVAYASRLAPDARGCGLPLAVLEPDTTDHEGDGAQWAAALGKLVTPRP